VLDAGRADGKRLFADGLSSIVNRGLMATAGEREIEILANYPGLTHETSPRVSPTRDDLLEFRAGVFPPA